MALNDKGDLIKVSADDLMIGDTLPWTVYDATGRLLMDSGHVISTQSRLNSIVSSGYRLDELPTEADEVVVSDLPSPVVYAKDTNPFNELEEMCLELEQAFGG
ncbi:hypothetical protein ABMA58_19875, partial [Oceanospirillum sp. HFRX-1_2]